MHRNSGMVGVTRTMRALALLALLALAGTPAPAAALSKQFDLIGPSGSGAFGTSVIPLPSGNIVVTDPMFSTLSATNVGAVYLYNGHTGALISRLTGSATDDKVGSGNPGFDGIFVLAGGDYVVASPNWHNGDGASVGAVTRCSGMTGCSGEVSAANSLVGASAQDYVGASTTGSRAVTPLTDGGYVVTTPFWHNGSTANAGAVTGCRGTAGCKGAVSPANSLVGSATDDKVGSSGATALANGNYVVNSPTWDNGPAVDAGAVTWCGGTGCAGAVSAANSLVGSITNDRVGKDGVVALPNGSYVVRSSAWNLSAGAVTWGSGTTGRAGPVSAANSLVGGAASYVGNGGVWVLPNGSYVVASPYWDGGFGAVTRCSGTTGCTGVISAANSLVGARAGDYAGSSSPGVTVLANGNYVVGSYQWWNGAAQAGAATWCSGTADCTGVISAANSLVGSSSGDGVGSRITALATGNYVVVSIAWNNGGTSYAGAVTWCDGTAGCKSPVSAANSLVGSTAADQIGYQVVALDNGSYVAASYAWDNGATPNAGAATWCSGTAGCTGPVSAANSLVGSAADDQVGYGTYASDGLLALAGGNYVVRSSNWKNGGTLQAGAVTRCDGTAGCTGPVSAGNSLVGVKAGDKVGYGSAVALTGGDYVVGSTNWSRTATNQEGAATRCSVPLGCVGPVSAANSLVGSALYDQVGYGLFALADGSYVVRSPFVDNGAISNAGALTWCSADTPCIGPISAANTVKGGALNMGTDLRFVFDAVNHQLVVGQPVLQRVTLLRIDLHGIYLPVLVRG
jgi:hypothetical protein